MSTIVGDSVELVQFVFAQALSTQAINSETEADDGQNREANNQQGAAERTSAGIGEQFGS